MLAETESLKGAILNMDKNFDLKDDTKLSADKCLLCNSKNVKQVYRLAFGDVFNCLNCNYAYTIFDDTDVPYDVETDWGDVNWIKTKLYTLSHNRATENERLKVLQTFLSAGKLLEFGANVGSFLWVANQQGFDVSGTDLHCNLLHVNHIENAKFYHTDAMNCSFDQTFDVITGFQFLEHLDNPIVFLKNIEQYLNPGGYLFFEVPNYNSHYRIKDGDNWQHFHPGHFSHFDKTSLRIAFEKTGYKVVYENSLQPTDFIVDPYYLPLRNGFWKLIRKLFSGGENDSKYSSQVTNAETKMTFNDEVAIINSKKGMVSRFERGLQKFVALFVQPYAKYLANKDQGDIIQIIARKK